MPQRQQKQFPPGSKQATLDAAYESSHKKFGEHHLFGMGDTTDMRISALNKAVETGTPLKARPVTPGIIED